MELLARLVAMAQREGEFATAQLYLVAYVFLLRGPSEGIPLVIGRDGEAEQLLAPGAHSCLSFVGDDVAPTLVLRLARRKNNAHGWVSRANCWCGKSAAATACCPIHELGMTIARQAGETPFLHISAGAALATLRRHLTALEVEGAESYRLHDFRRGHTRDIQASGGTLYDILTAGGWSSPAFMSYLDVQELESEHVLQAHERDQIVQAHVDESDSDVEG